MGILKRALAVFLAHIRPLAIGVGCSLTRFVTVACQGAVAPFLAIWPRFTVGVGHPAFETGRGSDSGALGVSLARLRPLAIGVGHQLTKAILECTEAFFFA